MLSKDTATSWCLQNQQGQEKHLSVFLWCCLCLTNIKLNTHADTARQGVTDNIFVVKNSPAKNREREQHPLSTCAEVHHAVLMLLHAIDCDLRCNDTGTKSGLVEAFQSGNLVSLKGRTAPIKQYATNLEHWLHTDAHYGVQYTKVSIANSKHITKAWRHRECPTHLILGHFL